MTPRFRGRLPWRAAATICALLLLGACAAPPSGPVSSEPAPPLKQRIHLSVLTDSGTPLSGAQVEIIPLVGQPLGKVPAASDAKGQYYLDWSPQGHARRYMEGGDLFLEYQTDLRYRVEAPGYMPSRGRLSAGDRGRQVTDPRLAKLSREVSLPVIRRVIHLAGFHDLFGGSLGRRPLEDPLLKRCLGFYRQQEKVVQDLGADFARPAFGLRQGELVLTFNYLEAQWGEMGDAPLVAQVTVLSGLPLAVAVGQDLLPLEGVRSVSLELVAEATPPDDPHAAPQRKLVRFQAPAQTFRDLALGDLPADQFLAEHPPQVVRLGP